MSITCSCLLWPFSCKLHCFQLNETSKDLRFNIFSPREWARLTTPLYPRPQFETRLLLMILLSIPPASIRGRPQFGGGLCTRKYGTLKYMCKWKLFKHWFTVSAFIQLLTYLGRIYCDAIPRSCWVSTPKPGPYAAPKLGGFVCPRSGTNYAYLFNYSY